ncbi:MAG: hypothetical protein QOG90_2112 [Actinomycetota bacterium]
MAESLSRSDAQAVPQLAGELGSKDPAVGLRAVAVLRRLLEQIERLHVDNARDLDWSWQDIANVLGVSKQAAQQKHGPRRSAQEEGK